MGGSYREEKLIVAGLRGSTMPLVARGTKRAPLGFREEMAALGGMSPNEGEKEDR